MDTIQNQQVSPEVPQQQQTPTVSSKISYYSYRRDKSSPIEAMMAIIGMRD